MWNTPSNRDIKSSSPNPFGRSSVAIGGGGCGCGCGGQRSVTPPPPGPGLSPSGPGLFPPGPGLFPPGPGPFPPGPGPFPPGPGPFPIPLPPFPGPPAPYITVIIDGGGFFPRVTQAYAIPPFPGINVHQALTATGEVRFGFDGRILAVGGIPIAGSIETVLRLNGNRIPESLLYLPVRPGDIIRLELVVTGSAIPRDARSEETERMIRENLENNYETLGIATENHLFKR